MQERSRMTRDFLATIEGLGMSKGVASIVFERG